MIILTLPYDEAHCRKQYYDQGLPKAQRHHQQAYNESKSCSDRFARMIVNGPSGIIHNLVSHFRPELSHRTRAEYAFCSRRTNTFTSITVIPV